MGGYYRVWQMFSYNVTWWSEMQAVKNNVPGLWILFLKGENQRSFLSKASMKKPYKENYIHLTSVQMCRVLGRILAFQARFEFGPDKSAWESLVSSIHQELKWWFNSVANSTWLRKSPQFWFPWLMTEYYTCPIVISRRKGQCIWKRDIMSSGWSRNLQTYPYTCFHGYKHAYNICNA